MLPVLGLFVFAAFKPDPPVRAMGQQNERSWVPFLIDGGVSRPLRDTSLLPSAPSGSVPGLTFAGLGDGDHGFVPAGLPAHPNGAVGVTQYVQYANDSFAIFDKATGALVGGPITATALWTGMAGCDTQHHGALIVRHDAGADRWVVTQSAYSTGIGGPIQCLAFSTTPDATGPWQLLAIGSPISGATFDSARLGIWPDAYYFAVDVLGDPFVGALVCGIERTAVLGPGLPRWVCFPLFSMALRGLMPSDLDGSTPPPMGSPNYVLSLGSDSLSPWRLYANFGGSPTLVGPTTIPVAPFTRACGGGSCIPQPGTVQLLDSLSDRLMDRLGYRNFGDHESLVVSHSVDVGGGITGIRWYEIRDPGGVPAVHQQGTYGPDSSHRWMGSIAMDRSGNIALGYSVSSGSVYPSIRYAGRQRSNPPGTLQVETSLFEGSGSQLAQSGWGSLSSLALDPVDDCTSTTRTRT